VTVTREPKKLIRHWRKGWHNSRRWILLRRWRKGWHNKEEKRWLNKINSEYSYNMFPNL
jgi:hypothetical protein